MHDRHAVGCGCPLSLAVCIVHPPNCRRCLPPQQPACGILHHGWHTVHQCRQTVPCSVVAATLFQEGLPGVLIHVITHTFLPLCGAFLASTLFLDLDGPSCTTVGSLWVLDRNCRVLIHDQVLCCAGTRSILPSEVRSWLARWMSWGRISVVVANQFHPGSTHRKMAQLQQLQPFHLRCEAG